MNNRCTGFYPSLPADKGISVELDSVNVTIEFERTPSVNRSIVTFTVNGEHHVFVIYDHPKAIDLAKAKIAYGAAIGLYSWDVVNDVRDLIDATMGDD